MKNVYTDETLKSEIENTVMFNYAGKPDKLWRLKKNPQDYKQCLDAIPKSLK